MRTQFIDYLEANLSTSRASGGTQVVVHDDCPFCGASGGRIYVDAKLGIGIDHKCGEGFSALKFVMAYEGVNAAKARSLLEGSGDRFSTDDEEEVKDRRWWPETRAFGDSLEATVYMEGRGFSYGFCMARGLLFCPSNTIDDHGVTHWTANRVIIPIYDLAGECIGWQGRDITGRSRTKYLIQPGFDARCSLYNIQAIKKGEPIIVVEGVADAWGWIKAGFTNVVATWGKKISSQQLEMLAALNPSMVYIAWDGDAYLNRCRFAEDCAHLWEIRIVPMEDQDSDELSADELKFMIEKSYEYDWNRKILESIKA